MPSSPLESAGSELRAFDIFPFLRERWVLGLGEMMNYPGVLNAEPDVLDKIKIVTDKRIDGHAPGLSGADLAAYIAAGVESDHECTTVEEAREKLALGMYIMIREGSGTKNLHDLLPLVTPENERRCSFCTDDRHPDDTREGHVNYIINSAIKAGLNPVTAVRMATLNTAEYSPGCASSGGSDRENWRIWWCLTILIPSIFTRSTKTVPWSPRTGCRSTRSRCVGEQQLREHQVAGG